MAIVTAGDVQFVEGGILCRDLRDYLENYARLSEQADLIMKREHPIIYRALRFFGGELHHEFTVDRLTVKSVNSSCYERDVGSVRLGRQMVSAPRIDYVLGDGTANILCFIELSEKTDNESWGHAITTKEGDLVRAVVSESSEREPHQAELIKFYNHSLEERLKK